MFEIIRFYDERKRTTHVSSFEEAFAEWLKEDVCDILQVYSIQDDGTSVLIAEKEC